MMRISVISPEQVRYDGDATSVVAPAYDGELGILAGHAPLMTLLGHGTLRVTRGAEERRFTVDGGFLQVVDDVIRVVTEKAQNAAP